ncbi:activator-dependent family glycosyltransferase [Micromonospora sp. NPDC050686]|uniref:activator-dependent family glycosyltransferase n=1 Tax=Micromonospora sp. NPDC050686 TaxID=3154631 RepID=UPI0033F5B3E2
MRVLFVPAINRSQLYVMTPLAWALRTAGHQVRVASQPDLAEHIASIGLTPAPVGRPMTDLKKDMEEAEPEQDPVAPATDPRTRARSTQAEYGWGDPAATLAHLTWDFYKLLTPDAMIDDLVDYALRWRPDLIVWNTLAFAGPVAARVSGAAHARMPWGVDAHAQIRAGFRQARAERGEDALPDPMEQWLGPFLRRRGAHFDEEIALGQWTIDPAPPWVFHPADAGVHYVPMRPVPFNGPATVPDWVHEPPTRKRVCLTLGVSNREGHGVEASPRDLLEAVADLDIEVVATFNERQIGGTSGLPDNVRVVDFVPLSVLLPTCSAIVHHGGPGSFATALEHGVPQLIVNGTYWHVKYWGSIAAADGLESRGAGVHVADGDNLTPEKLRKELLRVLEDPSFARNAEQLRIESAGQPTPSELVPLLEKLTAAHRGRTR